MSGVVGNNPDDSATPPSPLQALLPSTLTHLECLACYEPPHFLPSMITHFVCGGAVQDISQLKVIKQLKVHRLGVNALPETITHLYLSQCILILRW